METRRKKKRKIRRRRFSVKKTARLVAIIAAIIIVISLFRGNGKDTKDSEEQPVAALMDDSDVEEPEVEYIDPESDTITDYNCCLETMPEPTVKIKVNYFGNPKQYFNDSNHVHMAEATEIGISPLNDSRSHWKLRRHIVKVESCEDYYVDRLTFSRPFLIPEAEKTLREIGHRFRDTIVARGGGDYRIKVTSLLRTPAGVKQLRRRNRNAVDSSVHRFATTFDISYASFIANSDTIPRSVDDLKGVLSEVLKAMREEGKIWVKYERKQPCFHITARRRDL